ncbi:MAG: hypothetical protein HFJ34_07035 [Clostridia bacterium]|nr:hypothetical protein [Clostridia bacterium]
MLKNKFKIIVLLAIIILSLTLPIVRAEDETTNNVAPENITQEISDNTNPVATSTEENFKKSDIYLTGDNITIDYIVDGNLFIIANHVTINSQIGGDAFICANSVTIGEQGYIFSNLFTFSKDVTINGVVYDLYSASENTTINGYIYRDIRVGSNTINIFGTVGRNAYLNCANLNFTKDTTNNEDTTTPTTTQTTITGNLNYTSKNEISIPQGVVTGETNFHQEFSFGGNKIQEQIMNLATFVVTIIVVWLLCLWLAPKFLKNNTSLLTTKKVLPVIGFGLLTPIVFVLLTILSFVLGITSVLGFLLLLTLMALIIISNSMFIITLNGLICQKLKIEKTMITFGMLVVCSIVLWLIGLIPIIGSILGAMVFILGIGIAVSSLVLRNKTKNTQEN